MTRPTSGVAHHPEVTRIVFETSARPDTAPAEKYAAMLLARTVGHLEKVDVGAIVSAYLEALDEDLDPDDARDFLGAEILRITALIETVLDHARATLRTRMSVDMATSLIPRLKGPKSV